MEDVIDRLKSIRKYLLSLLAIIVLVAIVVVFVPIPLPEEADFLVFYITYQALRSGIPLYDYLNQFEWVRSNILIDVTFLPFPYPPWYAFLTFPLAFLSQEVAARLWFCVNLIMITGTIWLLGRHLSPRMLLLSVIAAVVFVPSFSILIIGQYSLPVFFGIALFIWSTQQRFPPGIALALGLMTFKPHLGFIPAFFSAGWLIYHYRDPIVRQTFLWSGVVAVLFIISGFALDPRWPISYPESLFRYRNVQGVSECRLCASFPVAVMRLITGYASTSQAVPISIGLGLGLLAVVLRDFRRYLTDVSLFMSFAVITTLLINPYLHNYDYVLLLIPLTLYIRQSNSFRENAILFAVYLLPFSLLFLGRAGDPLLIVATVIMLVFLWQKTRSPGSGVG